MLGVVKADLAASCESDGMSCRGELNPCHAERNDLPRFAKQIMESKHRYSICKSGGVGFPNQNSRRNRQVH